MYTQDSDEEDQIFIDSNDDISQSFDQILNLWKSMLENECLDDN